MKIAISFGTFLRLNVTVTYDLQGKGQT